MTSRARQRDQAGVLVAGRGTIVAEFFDSGQSRTLLWARRLQAAALVAALADPDGGWDAIVIGEYERAFCGSQYAAMAPLFEHYGVQLWALEVGGRIDHHAEDHEQTMLALGAQSKREITRTRIRVRTAMVAQTREQGRYLGRPPYEYRLGDAGPHPNKAHAAWGRRAHRLEPDPATAPVVRWMFAQRLAAHSAAWITRALNDAGIPCPSAADPGWNPHRTGAGWTLRTVAAILANPRYTGRQVRNRQRTDFDLVDPANTGLGHRILMHQPAYSFVVQLARHTLAAFRRGAAMDSWMIQVLPLAALLTERLVRRQESAEQLTGEIRHLYMEQRSVAETLQHALLPQQLPDIAGVLREPGKVLSGAARTLDFTQPVALLLLGVLHHIPGTDQAQEIVRRLVAGLVPGSFLAVNHSTSAVSGAAMEEAVAHWNQVSAAWVAALVMMALADVLTRLVIIYLRGRRLATGSAATAARIPAGFGA